MKPNDKTTVTAPGNAPEGPNRLPLDKIPAMRDTLRRWPANYVRGVTDDGEGYLELATVHDLPCGCRVTGNGTLQLPLTVAQCAVHRAPAAPAALPHKPFTLGDSDREIAATLRDPATSDWLRNALSNMLRRDCVDSVHDAECLAGILSRRARAMLRDELDTVTDSNARPMPRGGSYTASLQLAQARAGHLG